MVRLRVPLKEEEMVDLTLVSPDDGNGDSGGDDGSGGSDGSGGDGGAGESGSLPEARFTLVAPPLEEALPGYSNSRYAHPCTIFSLAHPESDAPRVRAWFSGDYSGVTEPPSASLTTNLSKSLDSLLKDYYQAAARGGLLTSPCRVGAALRLSDGSRLPLGEPVTLFPDTAPPVVGVRSYTPSATMMSAYVEIFNLPKRVEFSLPGFSWKDVDGLLVPVAVDFYATLQSPWSPDPLTCTGLRTMTVGEGDGAERMRGFVYDGYEEEYVAGRAAADADFRIIGSMAYADAAGGVADEEVPLTAGAFSDWKTMPKLTWNASGGGSGDTPEEPGQGDPYRPYLHWLTPPLDLDDPEKLKRVRGVTLRGVFPRDSVRLTLYGSHHREHWRKVAESRGAMLRLVCGMSYRWWRVEIETPMRRGDFLDALAFTLV